MTPELIEVLTTVLGWGAAIMGGAARFFQQSNLHVTDYPCDTDIYCLGDEDLERRVWLLLKEKFRQPIETPQHKYGAHTITSYKVEVGRQFGRRSPRFDNHIVQLVHMHDLDSPHTITDVWDTYDMSICEAAIVYGQDRVVYEKHDIWLDEYVDVPNQMVKVIHPPLYIQRPYVKWTDGDQVRPPWSIPEGRRAMKLHEWQNEYLPWVGVVSDAFVEADRCNVTRYRYFPEADMRHAVRRMQKYHHKGMAFYWEDLQFLVHEPEFQPFLRTMVHNSVGSDEDKAMFKFLMDAAGAEYMKDIL